MSVSLVCAYTVQGLTSGSPVTLLSPTSCPQAVPRPSQAHQSPWQPPGPHALLRRSPAFSARSLPPQKSHPGSDPGLQAPEVILTTPKISSQPSCCLGQLPLRDPGPSLLASAWSGSHCGCNLELVGRQEFCTARAGRSHRPQTEGQAAPVQPGQAGEGQPPGSGVGDSSEALQWGGPQGSRPRGGAGPQAEQEPRPAPRAAPCSHATPLHKSHF